MALGLTISALVIVVFGSLTAVQLRREERYERTAREELLAESLAPLAVEIEQAATLAEIRRLLSSAERAELVRGSVGFKLALLDDDGRAVASSPPRGADSPPAEALQARTAVRSPALAAGGGTLAVWQDASDFSAEMTSRRRSAWIDIAVTVLAVVAVVHLVIYLLVTRPLHHLMTTIDKVEQGYPATPRLATAARELRWLEWRFARMSATLTQGARLLFAAHRRAMEVSRSRPKTDVDAGLFDPLAQHQGGPSAGHDMMTRYLRARCTLLDGLSSTDPAAWEIARQVWDIEAAEAERLGEIDLRSRLEDAALKILDRRTYERIRRELGKLAAARDGWFATVSDRIRSALAADHVNLVGIQRRTKHAAGVWRKMQEKHLSLHEVQDILAFRLIVADQDDCYLALHAVHRIFDPEPFRFKDYITAPKANGYRSLHTSVRDRDGLVFEVQIRSVEMHRSAESGEAAHWRYHAERSAILRA